MNEIAARWGRQLREKVFVPAVVALVTSSFTSIGIWQWQQHQLQRWGSQVVVDIRITNNDKALVIRNLGAVDISDVAVYFSRYTIGVKEREAGNWYLTGKIESVSKAGTPLKTWEHVTAQGGEVRWPLES